ncbi:MAG: thioredoxin domain-containing protein [Aggregatilineales bacterium]
MQIANQFSFVIFGALTLIGLIGFLILCRVRWQIVTVAGLSFIALFVATFLLLRPGASDVDTLAEAEAMLTNGQPTLLEFFSNYCTGCLLVRPAVDQLVAEIDAQYNGSFNLLRVDIHTPVGRALRERYGFSFTPEFILFNHDGREVWRSHVPPTGQEIPRLLTHAAESAAHRLTFAS